MNSMNIAYKQGYGEASLSAAHTLYTEACEPPEFLIDSAQQQRLCLRHVSQETTNSWFASADRPLIIAWDGRRPVGVAAGAEGKERACGYLTFLYVTPTHRGRGIGSRLLAQLEQTLTERYGVSRFEAAFYSPVHLPWCIPGGGEDHHPCLPGVDVGSGLYLMLKRRGWRDYAIQNAYYRRLAGYTDPPELERKRAALAAEGIEVTLYDPTAHTGLPELFEDIANPGWGAQVLAHTDRPIVVAVDHRAGGLVVAYTGPLSIEGRPGRGNFCGIGTRRDYRGRGIGTLVFCEMCRQHAEAGAEFMSLYTGETNPARNIYEAAGFRVVRTFADMRKEKRE